MKPVAKPKVFVSRALPGPALANLAPLVDLDCWPDRDAPTPAQLRDRARDCAGLICMISDRIDTDLLNAAPDLRVVSSCSVGLDHVDIPALDARGIALGHTPHVLTEATADLAFALLLAAARRLPEAGDFIREGQWTPARGWEPAVLLGKDLHGATLGLIGLGAIGQAVARRAQGFGLKVIGWTPSGRSVPGVQAASFDEVLSQSDFVSLHIALAAATRQLLDAGALARMRPDAVLINTARGGLVDETALIEALSNGRLAAAGLDVFAQEPIATDHPLLTLPNVVIAPHIGSATLGTRSRMAQLAVDNLLAGLRGEAMPHRANSPT